MDGVAVNFTDVPAHTVVADAPTLTLTGKFGFRVIVIPALVTVVGEAQVAVEVIPTVTMLPFANEAFE